ncbi:unnamed protein product [Aphanomyces euteiches]
MTLDDDQASYTDEAPDGISLDPEDGQEDIKLLHSSLRRHSRDGEENHSLEDLHGVVQTLYEEQENLLSSHMDAIQENADLLTEEGVLLSEVQGDSVVDYDIDQYASRLDEILAQKEKTIKRLRKQLAQFRQRCVEEENASKKVDQVSYY